jgi:hypothetical protein
MHFRVEKRPATAPRSEGGGWREMDGKTGTVKIVAKIVAKNVGKELGIEWE